MTGRPEFADMDPADREAFLSQLGSFTPDERSAFHRLSDAWEPKVNFRPILTRLESKIPTARQDMFSLMEKLRKHRIGVVRSRVEARQRVPEYFVLSDPGAAAFYTALLDEQLTAMQESIGAPLPLQSLLEEEGLEPPRGMLADVDAPGSQPITRIPVPGSDFLLASEEGLGKLPGILVAKLRYHLQQADLASASAEHTGHRFGEFSKAINAKDGTVWYRLARLISEHQDQITASAGGHASLEFFQSAAALKRILDVRRKLDAANQEAEQQKKADLAAVVEATRTAEGGVLPAARFEALFDPLRERYGTRFAEFRDWFTERVISPEKGRPEIVSIGGNYVHALRIAEVFETHLKAVRQQILDDYLYLMGEELRLSGRMEQPAFYTRESLAADILSRVEVLDGLLLEMLRKPQTVADGILRRATANRADKSSLSRDDMLRALSPWFRDNRIEYRETVELFRVDLSQMFAVAFDRQPVVKQILMRVLGRYEAYASRFAELRAGSPRGGGAGSAGNAGATQGASARGGAARPVPESARDSRSGRSTRAAGSSKARSGSRPAAGTASSRRPRPAAPTRPEDPDSAWKSFGDAMKK